MKIKTIALCCTLSLAALLTGCDSSHDKGSAAAPNAENLFSPGATPSPTPAPVPPQTLPFEEGKLNVLAAFPGPGEPRVALVSPISVQFDAGLIQQLPLENALSVSSDSGPVAGSVSMEEADTLVFRPETLWQPETLYTITVGSAVMSETGLEIQQGTHWQFTTVADVYTTPQAVIDGCMSDLDVEMLAAVNRARAEARLCGENTRPAVGKLIWDCLLQQAAITHAEDMATNDFFSHTGSDGSKVDLRITRTRYAWSHAAENLAAGQRTVAIVMDALLKSSGHCDNIMSPFFTEFGSGYRVNENAYYTRYWAQVFARPFRF